MDEKELFAKVIDHNRPCIMRVRDEHLANPTPCSEWDLRALLNHVVYELLWLPELLRGKTIKEVGTRFDGDVLGTNARSAWQRAADTALVAVRQADPKATVHLSYGDAPASKYITEVASDVLIHGWDAGQSMRCSIIFEPHVAQKVYEYLEPQLSGYRDSGAFGPALPVKEDATLQVKLLAITGRRGE